MMKICKDEFFIVQEYLKALVKELKDKTQSNKKRIKLMAKKRKKEQEKIQNVHLHINTEDTGNEKAERKGFIDYNHPLFDKIFAPIIVAAITGLAVFMLNNYTTTIELKASVATLTEEVKEIKESLTSIQVVQNKIDEMEKAHRDEIEKLISEKGSSYEFGDEIKEVISASNFSSGKVTYLNELNLDSTDIIAKNIYTGEECTLEQLSKERLLIPYEDDGKEVYFYGQYDENNNWDGRCIVNVYNNNILELITVAEYDSGVMVEYEQVYSFVTQRGEHVWAVSKRIRESEFSSGNTWTYYYEEDINKSFNHGNVTYGDILTVEKFEKIINKKIEGMYHGNISEGKFNDDTGNAYIIKYAEDGSVRTIYQGKIKNGVFEDNTGKAWYIVKDEDTSYMYYQGKFEKGSVAQDHTTDSTCTFINPISYEEIIEILTERKIECNFNMSQNSL